MLRELACWRPLILRTMRKPTMPAPQFRISSYCHMGGCVAVAFMSDGSIAVRDEKIADGPTLTFSADEWAAFVAGVKNAEFDAPTLR
jgi:Domain of unknown function (DUF397)